jgi:hypothetical protein
MENKILIIGFIVLIITSIFGTITNYNNQREILERNETMTNKINIYPAYDCEFITHRQEYWCVNVAPDLNSRSSDEDSLNKDLTENQK